MSPTAPVTALVAVYNEARHLGRCLESLLAQSYQPLEIIVADDGSTDRSADVARGYPGVRVLSRPHAGKAKTMNAAAAHATGEILLFLDGDLSFDPDYVRRLVEPIVEHGEIGTCHGTEHVANPDNPWSRCWQRRAGLPPGERLQLTPEHIAAGSQIYRALRADLFRSVNGFDDTGHTDDRTLYPKLRRPARFVREAVCYHYNVETLREVFGQGVWGGKSLHLTHGARALLHYLLPLSLFRAVRTLLRERSPRSALYDLTFEAGIFWGVLRRSLRLDATHGR
jgi:glycosyltransferase involved in cell wall biosynthesis